MNEPRQVETPNMADLLPENHILLGYVVSMKALDESGNVCIVTGRSGQPMTTSLVFTHVHDDGTEHEVAPGPDGMFTIDSRCTYWPADSPRL